MAHFQTIVVPHDGSPLADRALPYAAALSRVSGGDVVLLRVLEELRPIYDEGAREIVWIDPSAPRAELESTDLLSAPRAWLSGQGVHSHAVVRVGEARHEIVAEAAAHPDATIVLGSHGRGGIGRVFLGSVATRVLQSAHCPVLLVRTHGRGHPQELSPVELRRVTVLLDGSALAEAVLPAALALAGAGSTLHLVRVAETYRDELPPDPEHALAPPSYHAMLRRFVEIEDEARDYLESVAERLRAELPSETSVTWETLSGHPWRQVERYAERDRPDLIVMTTHGRGGITRWIFGSVADRLVTASDIPLLIVRSVAEHNADEATAEH
jgi:nucleotide-binding universal stress UspA family protein